VKYQLSRRLFLDKFPGASLFDFRRVLLSPSYGQRSFERHLFDWQITPFAGVLDYLENDFKGVFERRDLFVEMGQVTHRRHLMRYPHDFHPGDGPLDEAAVDRQYPAAREKFEHLARKFRRLLEQSGPFLYVARVTPTREDALRLRRLLQRAHPDHAFELLFLGWEDPAAAPDLDGVAHWAFVTLDSDKGAGREWEGNDEAWDQALAEWNLTVHGGDRIARRYEDAAEAPAQLARA
jgi:hypothetical protein